MRLSPAQRVDLLFRALHGPGEDELTVEFVAAALEDQGIEVSAARLAAVRDGTESAPPHTLLVSLAEYFSQAPWYLTDPGDAPRVVDAYSQLDLLRALRDAGVQRVRLRGRPGTADRQSLTESLGARTDSDTDR
ncbi:hypothetical protein [Nocardia sp. BMG51109]|uniref:hypothetical protein n=1 Tax=Nocardia sp. BMG51109 TaxID=1056816 RepID=UPI0004648D89|nr:hypothetical protein [Nocardia sp. BMG51109]